MAIIEIKNLKNIGSLQFEIPSIGVHLIAGVNGCGKTTLLACLKRIRDGAAFKDNFRTSDTRNFDDFSAATIKYSHNNREVTFAYRGSRWSPTPKRNGDVLSNMGFSQVVHISSNPERFYVLDREVDASGLDNASDFIRTSMSKVFGTTKYNNLMKKPLELRGRRVSTARRNTAYLLPLSTSRASQNKYATERNFSLGEIMVLNALSELESINDNSLLLVDEIELALHPKVQVAFYRLLEELASNKNLTVLLSTHSGSLIRIAKRVIFLQRDDATGEVIINYNCYPALALQGISELEEIQPDYIFLVEDNWARNLLEAYINSYFQVHQNKIRPIIKVVKVGTWKDTILFAGTIRNTLFFSNTKIIPFLDADAQSEFDRISRKPNKTPNEIAMVDAFSYPGSSGRFLPITPELGIVDFLRSNSRQHNQRLGETLGTHVDIERIIRDESSSRGVTYDTNNPRNEAKTRMRFYIETLTAQLNREDSHVEWQLTNYYVKNSAINNPNMTGIFDQIFNRTTTS